MSVWQYSLGTLLSILPGLVAATVFGREFAMLLAGDEHARYGVLAATVAVFFGFTYAIRRWTKKRMARKGAEAEEREQNVQPSEAR